uniref:Uncharacterized protein n=1 Tax=Arion vulgaris TaxID=1028688 RepID=A0A0B6ZJW9_9EUPU
MKELIQISYSENAIYKETIQSLNDHQLNEDTAAGKADTLLEFVLKCDDVCRNCHLQDDTEICSMCQPSVFILFNIC